MDHLKDRVILIINGLHESGRVLAKLFAQKGADVVVVDSRQNAFMATCIEQDVQDVGRRCLVVTPDLLPLHERSFAQFALAQINERFDRLDAFVTYADGAADVAENGRLQNNPFFDGQGLAKASLQQIIAKT